MPTEGYIRSRPDWAWWEEQIREGIEFRKKFACENDWPRWRDYYRGNWSSDILPVNLFFTMMRTIVPRIYFRNPTISVVSGKPGFLNMTFARVLERIDNKLLRSMRFKRQMKRITQQAFMLGTSHGKIGIGGFFSPTVEEEGAIIPLSKQGNAVEYFNITQDKMPWFSRVNTGNIIYPAGLEDVAQARWIAEYIERPLADVQEDPRFENTSAIKSSVTRNELTIGSISRSQKIARLYEIRDRKTGKVFVIAPDSAKDDKTIFMGDDIFQSFPGLKSPYFQVVFNEDDESVWGVPDSKILEPYQLEINETATQIMKHRRLSLVKVLVKERGMKPEEAEKLISEDVAAVAFVQGNPNEVARWVQTSNIPQELFLAAEQTMRNVRETIGFSRNQMGEFNSRSADTTATEATIVKLATEIRVDERRDILADVVVDVVETMHGLIFENWGEEQIVDLVGPGGIPVWVHFRSDLFSTGRYLVNVDPDSSLPETRDLRERRAMELYGILRTNPLVDPVKLTQYLLRELRGVQFDDMMKMLPVPEGGIPGQAISPADFAQMIGNSFAQLGRPGGGQRVSPPVISGRAG